MKPDRTTLKTTQTPYWWLSANLHNNTSQNRSILKLHQLLYNISSNRKQILPGGSCAINEYICSSMTFSVWNKLLQTACSSASVQTLMHSCSFTKFSFHFSALWLQNWWLEKRSKNATMTLRLCYLVSFHAFLAVPHTNNHQPTSISFLPKINVNWVCISNSFEVKLKHYQDDLW